jgi:glutathione synthase/RimK-type ligase-like ATP-grasp enzyme
MARIGLIAARDREETRRLQMRLEERSAEAVVLDAREDATIRMGPDGESACGVDLRGFTGFYVADLALRSPVVEDEQGKIDRAASREALAASQRQLSAWNSLLLRLAARCPVVNPPQTHDLHALKPWEMAVYERGDLPAPFTLSTSDPAALLAPSGGVRTKIESWIQKGMVGGYGYTTSFLPPGDLDEARQRLEERPLMVQERVQGDNLRAFVLDGKVIGAARIVPREADEVDSRRDTARVQRVELPPEAVDAAVRAARTWGLVFAAVDMMEDRTGSRHAILECNSAPFFVNFERATGLDVSSRLATYLVKGAERGRS